MAVNLIILPLVKMVCVVIPLVGITSLSGYFGFVLSYDIYCRLRNRGYSPPVCFLGHQAGLNIPNWCVFCLYHFILTQPLHTTTLRVGVDWWVVVLGKLRIVITFHFFRVLYGRLSLEALWRILLSLKSRKKVSFNLSLLNLKGASALLYIGWGVSCTVGLITPLSVLDLTGFLILRLVLFFNNVTTLFIITSSPSYKRLASRVMINLIVYVGIFRFVVSVLIHSV